MSFTENLEKLINESNNKLLSIHSSWVRIGLGVVAEVQNGFPFSSNKFNTENGFPLIRIRDITKNSTQTKYDGEYNDEYIVSKNDLLVGMDGDFNSNLWLGEEGLLNQRVCRIKPNESFYSRRFLSYVLPAYLNLINSKTSAVTVKHLSSITLKDIPLPLPPLNEQHRIVEKIEELFSKLDAAQKEQKNVKQQLKRYRQSVLKSAFEGKLTEEWRKKLSSYNQIFEEILQTKKKDKIKIVYNFEGNRKENLPNNWLWVSADEISKRITDGEHVTPKRTDDGIYLLSARNILNGIISLEKVDYISEEEYEKISKRLIVEEGDVLLSCSGSVGRSAVVPSNMKFSLVRSVAVIKTYFEMGKYLSYCIRSPFIQNQIDRLKTQTAQANIFQNAIKRLIIPLPPLEEQQKIVEEIETRFSVADKIEEEIDRNLKKTEQLRQSILNQAFQGKLVPQDPNDEPAEELLKRIKAEKVNDK